MSEAMAATGAMDRAPSHSPQAKVTFSAGGVFAALKALDKNGTRQKGPLL